MFDVEFVFFSSAPFADADAAAAEADATNDANDECTDCVVVVVIDPAELVLLAVLIIGLFVSVFSLLDFSFFCFFDEI